MHRRAHGKGRTNHPSLYWGPLPTNGTHSLDSSRLHPFHCIAANLLCLEQASFSLEEQQFQILDFKPQINLVFPLQITTTSYPLAWEFEFFLILPREKKPKLLILKLNPISAYFGCF
jgi:hypothetical protein